MNNAAKILPVNIIKFKQYYPKYWAERPIPIKGESFSSWIIRISLANLEKTSTLTGVIGCYPSHFDLDLKFISEIAQYLSEKTKVSDIILIKTGLYEFRESIINTIEKYNPASVVKDLWLTGWRKRAKNGLRCCPVCLKEDKIPFFRKIWRLAYIPICLKHNCFLLNKCPKCNSPITPYELKWDSNLTRCFNCGYELTIAKPEYISKSDFILSIYKDLNYYNAEEIYKILTIAWFIANHCSFSDGIFENHKFTKDLSLLELEKKNLNKPNKKAYFTNLYASYLLIGTSIKIYKDKQLLKNFLQKYHSSNNVFWSKIPYICLELGCNFTEASYTRMRIHIKRHNDEREYYCIKCAKNFLTKWDFENHIKLHDKPHPFKCPIIDCNQKFRHEKQYIHHLRADHKIRPYLCNICNKRFDRRYNLETHIRSHTGEKPYICEKCGKSFSQKSEITVHLRTHIGEKPYVCDVCGKAFTQSHSLTEHFRIYTNERPYACPRCEKKYKRKHHLNAHMMSHTGKKPFICEKCGKGFSDKGNMKKHLASHSDQRKYECNVCGKSYKYSSGLSKHKREKH